MATANSTRARGIQIERYFWGLWVKGTREMLVQHGYAQPGPFPGDPGERKYSIRATDPEGRAIEIKRASKYLFVVRRDWSESETAAYEKAEEKRKARQEETDRASRIVNSWPKSAANYRDDTRKTAESMLGIVERLVSSGCAGGYRYDEDAALRLRLLADQMLTLIETGGVVKDLMLREEYTPDCMAKTVKALDTAKQDKQFQRFMAGVSKQ